MEELLSLKWNNHCSTFLRVLSNVRNKQKYTDVTLACEGKLYTAHRIVLSSCSEYFKEIFDTTDCKSLVVLLKDIKSIELEAILDYMYIGEVNVRQTELASLIKVAECLQIKGLAVVDDEPVEKSSKFKRSLSSPRPKKRKKYDECQSSYISPPAKVKASQTFNINTDTLNDFVDEKNILIKEEEIEVFAVEDNYVQEDIVERSSTVVAPLPPLEYVHGAATSEIDRDHSIEDSPYPDITSYNEEDSKEWLGEESNMDFAPTNYDTLDISSSSNMPKMKRCQFCGKGFRRQACLTVHERHHTGERPFACNLCSYTAIRKDNLQIHMAIHTGEKPFACNCCQYKTSQKSHLTRHMLTHQSSIK